jgi:ammonium transporter, Amt family
LRLRAADGRRRYAGGARGTAPLNHEFAINLFGRPFGLFGLKGFFLGGDSYDVGLLTLFLFQ